jgi:hypothetical protein
VRRIAPATGALAEMMAADAEFEDEQPFGSHAQILPMPEPAPTPPIRPTFPAPDWEAERLEREARERADRAAAELAAELEEVEPAEPPARPTPPAPKRNRWRRSST